MFEHLEKELKNDRVKIEAKRMLADMMSEALLESDAPESVKLGLRVLLQIRNISTTMNEGITKKYVSPGKRANTETLKYVLEYLQMVEVGIKQFVETTPFVADTEEEEQ